MTTQNTRGTLTNRIILSHSYDQEAATNEEPRIKQHYTGVTAGELSVSLPDHWQDKVPDAIMDYTVGSSPRIISSLAIGNEFELDVESLTHTWQTVSVIAPLPGMAQSGPQSEGSGNNSQIKALHIDLGMMREVISVQGVLYDADNHPSSTSGHHIRRQHLLDIARSQWFNVHNFNRVTAFEWNNANKYPALTIGPMHGRNTSGSDRDLGYYGDEPSSDVRGNQRRAIEYPFARDDNSYGDYSWDYTFNYKGRRRYRGMIRRLTLTALAGQPNIWRYNFDFEVVKNELELRMMFEEDPDSG